MRVVWERTKIRAGLRRKQRKELRTARKAKSRRKKSLRMGTLWQRTEREICKAIKKTKRKIVFELINMEVFV